MWLLVSLLCDNETFWKENSAYISDFNLLNYNWKQNLKHTAKTVAMEYKPAEISDAKEKLDIYESESLTFDKVTQAWR